MPVVVRLARHLYSQRIEEIKSKLSQEQHEFHQLAAEIHAIQAGEWDAKLKPDPAYVKPSSEPETTPMTEQPSHDDSGTKENQSATATEAKKEDEAVTDSTLILQENRLKRTSSEAIAHEPHPLKRSRLSDASQEDQVVSTAVSRAPLHVEQAAEQTDADPHPATEQGTMDANAANDTPPPPEEEAPPPLAQHHAPVPNIMIPHASEPSLTLQSPLSSKCWLHIALCC